MNPEQQLITIAEACGWKNVDAGAGRVWGFTTRHKGTPSESDVCVDIPNYLNDLNAMHEAEELFYAKPDTLEGAERMRDYSKWLCRIAKYPLHATATQRAEAFIRTIGKWEEAK